MANRIEPKKASDTFVFDGMIITRDFVNSKVKITKKEAGGHFDILHIEMSKTEFTNLVKSLGEINEFIVNDKEVLGPIQKPMPKIAEDPRMPRDFKQGAPSKA